MRLDVFIAVRYLFSRKKQSLIHLISLISMGGVAVGTMALIVVLSVMNGFMGLIYSGYNSFLPDLRLTPTSGQVMDQTAEPLKSVALWPEWTYCYGVLEQQVLLEKHGVQVPVMAKGVPSVYSSATSLSDLYWVGKDDLNNPKVVTGVLGANIANNLQTGVDYVVPTKIYTLRRKAKFNALRPDLAFKKSYFYVGGVTSLNLKEVDDEMCLLPLRFVQNLSGYDSTMISSIEIRMKDYKDVSKVERRLKKYLGKHYVVANRAEQQADFYHIMKIEKWLTFMVLAFIVLIGICNVIGSLSMLIVDKDDDIKTYISLGATPQLLQRIFWFEGWLITLLGTVIGLVLGLILCWLQIKFQLVSAGGVPPMPYPLEVAWSDVVTIVLSILGLGALIAYIPVHQLRKNRLE